MYRLIAAAALLLTLMASLNVHGQLQKPSEYEVKAAYLLNFVRFVQWPPTPSVGLSNAINICVLGHDPFGSALDRIVGGEQIGGKSVMIRRVTRVEEVEPCRVLFIDFSEHSQLARIVAALRDSPVLTVSDIPEFVLQGGMVQFVLKDNRVRFDINVRNAERVGLVLSSQLLNVAASVRRDQ